MTNHPAAPNHTTAPALWMSIDGSPVGQVSPHQPLVLGRGGPGVIPVGAGLASPCHLEVRCTVHGWVVTDLGSAHGTWIDGRRLDRPAFVDRPLRLVIGPPSGGCSLVDLYPSPRVAAAAPTWPVSAAPRRGPSGVGRSVAALVITLGLLCGLGAALQGVAHHGTAAAADPQPAPTTSITTVPSTTSTQAPAPRSRLDALPTTPPPTAPSPIGTLEGRYRGDRSTEGMTDLLDALTQDVHAYWGRVFDEAGLPAPSVRHRWIEAGAQVESPCHEDTDPGAGPTTTTDTTAMYCAVDDQITIALPAAMSHWDGTRRANDDDASGFAAGDLSVGFMVAHEYAHNVQQELGLIADHEGRRLRPVIAIELHADCLAGLWANAAWRAHLIDDDDAAEAMGALARIGDYAVTEVDHHGTPTQRMGAFELGYESGAPAVCTPLLDTPAAA